MLEIATDVTCDRCARMGDYYKKPFTVIIQDTEAYIRLCESCVDMATKSIKRYLKNKKVCTFCKCKRELVFSSEEGHSLCLPCSHSITKQLEAHKQECDKCKEGDHA